MSPLLCLYGCNLLSGELPLEHKTMAEVSICIILHLLQKTTLGLEIY